MAKFIPKGMGWIPDLPDPRDYNFRHEAVLPLLKTLRRSRRKMLPDNVDLRIGDEGEDFFTEPNNHGQLNSSSSFAVLSLIEYFERRIRGRTFDGSQLFLYKVTRNLIHKQQRVTADTGADLRRTLKVLVQFGVPPELFWPYEIDNFDAEPSAFLYGRAKHFLGFRYFRLDVSNTGGETTWSTLKSFLAAGFPVVFGFPVPSSLTATAEIPYRPDFDSIRGGQAVVAVGYQSNRFGRGHDALLIRSSWGSQWGDNGIGWLPVAYVRKQLARDFWTIISEDWLDSGELLQPSVVDSLHEETHGRS